MVTFYDEETRAGIYGRRLCICRKKYGDAVLRLDLRDKIEMANGEQDQKQ